MPFLTHFRARYGVYSDFENIHFGKILSEVGYYSWSLSDSEKIYQTGFGDYLVRSKKLGTDEGGICTGFAFIDSFSLV
jgi:hypothetical protein